MMQIGIDHPALQVAVHDRLGLAGRLDFGFLLGRVGGEVDGEKEHRLAALAPSGPAEAVVAEKRREDRLRRRLDALARRGWRDSGGTALLTPILAAARVLRVQPRATLADCCTPFLVAAV